MNLKEKKSMKQKEPKHPRAHGVVQALLLLSVFLLFMRRHFFLASWMRAYRKSKSTYTEFEKTYPTEPTLHWDSI